MKPDAFNTKLTSLINRAENWHTTHFIPTRNELYQIHGDIYNLSLIVDEDFEFQKELKDKLKEKGISITSNTSIELMLVKLTFAGIDRRKASSYAIPMSNAKKEGVKSGGYVKWLTRPYSKKSDGTESDDDTHAYVGIVGKRALVVNDEIETSEVDEKVSGESLMATLKAFGVIPSQPDTPQTGTHVILLGRVNHLRQTELINIIDKKGLVDAAVAELANKHHKSPIENIPYNDIDTGEPVLTPKSVKTKATVNKVVEEV